jgi:amidase
VEEIREAAAKYHINLTEDKVEDFAVALEDTLNGYERLDELSDPRPDVQYTNRDPGYMPNWEEDPLNAFVTKCRVEGNDSGPLSDYEVGLKDSIALAGIEMQLDRNYSMVMSLQLMQRL